MNRGLLVAIAVAVSGLQIVLAQDESPLDTAQTARDEDARDRVLFSDETERIGPLTKKLVRNILMDQRDIWTSPLHMSRKDAVSWLVIGGSTGALVASD